MLEFLKKGKFLLTSTYLNARRLFLPAMLFDLDALLIKYAKFKSGVNFIQIGSNDGSTNDPLHNLIKEYSWNGILVEPMPKMYEKLRSNYHGYSKLNFENVAIAKNDGFQDFYYLSGNVSELPKWHNQISSFNANHILNHKKHFSKNIKTLIKKRKVNTLTFNSLIRKYDLKRINVVHLDVEGYEPIIIDQIDFNELKIDLLLFENKHIEYYKYISIIANLKKLKFVCRRSQFGDTIAIRKSVWNALK